MNYLQTSTTVTAWRRAGSIRIVNPLPGQGTPSIVFEEQDVVELSANNYNVTMAPSGPAGVGISFDPTQTFDLINPEDGTVIGTASHAEFQVMLYSLYLNAAKTRDDAAAAAAALAEQRAQEAAFKLANPTPSISFAVPYSFNVTMGGTGQNAALSTLAGGNFGAITYASSDDTIATVDALGNVSPVSVGQVTITATQAAVVGSNATASASYTLTVVALPIPVLTVAFATLNGVSVGSTTNNFVTSTLMGPPYGALDFVSSDTDVATVNGQGLVTAVSPGTSIITVTQEPVAGVNAQAQTEYTIQVVAAPAPAPQA